MPQKRKAFIHIGTEKTGTTTIQRLCAESRASLRRQGFVFPESPGRDWDRLGSNHYALAMLAIGQRTYLSEELFDLYGKGLAESGVIARFESAFAEELGRLRPEDHSLILSSEFLQSRVRSPDQIRVLRTFLDRFCDEYTIIVYLRRQDRVAASHYTTLLMNGHVSERILPDQSRIDHYYFDYNAILENWSQVFGEARIRVRIFEREALADGNLAQDFSELVGIPAGVLPVQERRENASLSRFAQAVLIRYNQRWIERFGSATGAPGRPESFRPNRWRLAALLNRHFPGPSAMPPRQEAKRFLERFEAANEAVRARWFPDRPTLFAPGFSDFPEADAALGFAEAELLNGALDIIAEMSNEPATSA